MLTRLKVRGFKNLLDVDVRFGPFTCIAGPNAAGKSNLFDAIRFLGSLADKPLLEAALSVRDEKHRSAGLQEIFYQAGDYRADRITLEAEMLIPPEGADVLGQRATASISLVRYRVALGYRADEHRGAAGRLELLEEVLEPIQKGIAHKHLTFPCARDWRESVVQGRGRRGQLISTETSSGEVVVQRHQEGRSGRVLKVRATDLPRTVLSSVNSAEGPTAVLTRREMQEWQLLQLEPSALRQSDPLDATPRLGADGSHLAATLSRIARSRVSDNGRYGSGDEDQVYARVANRLAELISDVHRIAVDRDERRELLTVQMYGRDGAPRTARSLSDGTLRFLALTVMEMDPEAGRLLCLEEPENGVHPERIPAMLRLLADLATDPSTPVDRDNPLRQVIVNTHSPGVVAQVLDQDLLLAEPCERIVAGTVRPCVQFRPLPDTWRCEGADAESPVARGVVTRYLGSIVAQEPGREETPTEPRTGDSSPRRKGAARAVRVMEREDLQPFLPFRDLHA